MKIKKNDVSLFTKIGNLYPTPINNGIIRKVVEGNSKLKNKLSSIDGYTLNGLDLDYYKRSSGKSISTLCEFLLKEYGLKQQEGYYIPSTNFNNYLVDAIHSKYLDKWLKLLDTLLINYEPLSPYNMQVNDNITKDHLESTDKSNSSGNTVDKDNTNYYGFNSQSSVPIDESGSTSTSSDERNANYERDITRDRQITRKGNIGNKTNQELITEERKLNMWLFFDEMFKDIDKILASPIWEN